MRLRRLFAACGVVGVFPLLSAQSVSKRRMRRFGFQRPRVCAFRAVYVDVAKDIFS